MQGHCLLGHAVLVTMPLHSLSYHLQQSSKDGSRAISCSSCIIAWVLSTAALGCACEAMPASTTLLTVPTVLQSSVLFNDHVLIITSCTMRQQAQLISV
jgi:hypothetical protein